MDRLEGGGQDRLGKGGGGEYKFQGYFKSLLTVRSIMIFEKKGLENILRKTKRRINLNPLFPPNPSK